jgi:hypothetical protein
MKTSTELTDAGPRDATRGGVNGPALPVQPPEGGYGKAPLSIDAWTKAKTRGVQVRDLQRWIDAKKRIYGF